MTTKPQEYSTEKKRPGAPGKPPKPLHVRIADFWSYVNKNGPIPKHCPHLGPCWIWLKSCLKSGGYGQFNINGDMWRAHVLSYVLTRGDIPDGIWICHHCDNPKCVNPDHLFPGTPQDDMTDMIKKGRAKHAFCETHPSSLHTDAQIANLKAWLLEGKTSKARLGRMFNFDRSSVTKIGKGLLWKQVQPAPFPTQPNLT
jgi:hypothetical protein